MQPTVIKDFISPNKASEINKYLRNKTTINPKGLLNVQLDDISRRVFVDGDIKEMNNSITEIIELVKGAFGFPIERVEVDRVLYQILQEGEGLGWHTDIYGVDGYSEDNYYSALLYLTDDYEGGEILFYEKDSGDRNLATAYKPTPGTLIHFKGDDNHPHSVNDVISGERANLIFFFFLKPA
jgi:hypothetical protein